MANENQKTVVNNEEALQNWMKTQEWKSGTVYGDNTCKEYAKALNGMAEEFPKEISPYKNIFNIDTFEDFEEIQEKIIKSHKFKDYNKDLTRWREGTPSAALGRYGEFLHRDRTGENPVSYDYFRLKAEEYPNVDKDAAAFYQKFQDEGIYSWKTLEKLAGEDILNNIFLYSNKDKESIIHALVYNEKNNEQFGDTGKTYALSKYGVFYSNDESTWKVAQEYGKPKPIRKEEAIKIGTATRNALVKGAKIIEKWGNSVNTIEDYLGMFEELNNNIQDYISQPWVLKYYHMSFPGIFPIGYSEDLQYHILYSLHIMPNKDLFARIAQIACYIKECGISSVMLYSIVRDTFGDSQVFYRIGTGEGDKSFFDEWKKENYVAIGWKKLGNLDDIYKKGASNKEIKEEIQSKLKNMGYNVSKYGEINKFYMAPVGSYVVAMKGRRVCGLGEIIGDYEYKADKEYAHSRPVKWKEGLGKDKDGLIMIEEKRNTTFSEINKTWNIFRLYPMLHGPETVTKDYRRNLIFFGAPGTGKSHDLNELKDKLFKDYTGDYERVTFHPDYSYAHFVGTYKPVVPDDGPNKGEITYEYVPGPFMRIYVKAKKDPDKKFLLIIEEINRANVAAVFGDVFQLLDRTKDGGSEYSVAASEDMKGYLKANGIEDCEKIAIPPNMYIWATMNSADQGVFPMDTAFKRRWDFKYLGIDHNAKVMNGYEVPVPHGDTDDFMEWNVIRTEINNLLADEDINVNEDKQLGAFFINVEIIKNARKDPKTFKETFENKVLMYLFEDAARHRRDKLFGRKTIRYSEVCKAYEDDGLGVFVKLKAKYGKKDNKHTGDLENESNQESAGASTPEGENN